VFAVADHILLIIGTIHAELSLWRCLGPSLRLRAEFIDMIAKFFCDV
jgi:hypothetical protein